MKLTYALLVAGYSQSIYDYSIFTKGSIHRIYFLVYVDNLLITGSDEIMIAHLKFVLTQHFKLKYLVVLRYFLCIEVVRSSKGIVLNQRKYALDLIHDSGLLAAKPCFTPMEQNLGLTTAEYDNIFQLHGYDSLLVDSDSYRRLVGRLLYLTMTRPDIAYSIQRLRQFMHQPKKSHLAAALRVLHYIKHCPGQGIFNPQTIVNGVTAYFGSDWATCPFTRHSLSGYCVKLGRSMISRKVKKQPTVAKSSIEAEYRSIGSVVSEVVRVRGLLVELGFPQTAPTSFYCDNNLLSRLQTI